MSIDGWGLHAWYRVLMPEQVFPDPDSLTREEFLSELNVEARRIMQERMSRCFVRELGGQVSDTSLHYEVYLPTHET